MVICCLTTQKKWFTNYSARLSKMHTELCFYIYTMGHRANKVSSMEINCLFGAWCPIFFILQVNLWILDSWKYIQLSTCLMNSIQTDRVCVRACVRAPRVGIVCFPGLFLNLCAKISFSLKDESISRLHQLLWWRWKRRGFHSKLNMKCGVVSLCRCWGLFRSGAACQPWSRNCSDAAASSSTAPFWRCSSRPPPSAHTSAPRGQTIAVNKL